MMRMRSPTPWPAFAARLLEAAAGGCPPSFIEWDAANAELEALGVRP